MNDAATNTDAAPATGATNDIRWQHCQRLTKQVLDPIKASFVGKDEIVDLLGVSLIAQENLFLLGPPGTAESAIVRELASRLHGHMFDYLLTRFTEPNELFGPFDIRKLREGELLTNTEGMLPEADFVFLDELLNANSAILNSLLMVLNERIFRRGRETRDLPLLMVVGTSNNLPEDDALGALFDRFLLRARCDNLGADQLASVISAGWQLESRDNRELTGMGVEDVRALHGLLREADFTRVRSDYVALIQRLRHAGIQVSDRRAVKLQRLMAASAVLCGRLDVNRTDMWVLRYIWDTEEQQEVLASIVRDAIAEADADEQQAAHPQSQAVEQVDPDKLAEDLDRIAERHEKGGLSSTETSQLRDQVGLLAGRCQWVDNEQQQRKFLQAKSDELLKSLGEAS